MFTEEVVDGRAACKKGDAINVFVHLAHEQDIENWSRRFQSGSLIGINDPSPYGYARAQSARWRLTFSRSRLPEGFFAKLVRRSARAILGFDFVHALRNADGILSADVIWTHMEQHFLAAAFLLRLRGSKGPRPKIIAQSVWFIDNWERQPFLHRLFHRWLIKQGIDVLTFHSPENMEVARRIFPETPSELVLFGIPSEEKRPPCIRDARPIKVLAVGNDRHRDWKTAIRALRNQPGIELTILSRTASPDLTKGCDNVRIMTVDNNTRLFELYEQATLMLVPLKPNMHASGITAIQEAALRGLPVIATDTGGLRAYFEDDAVCYVPPSDPAAILKAVRELPRDPSALLEMARKAQNRMGDDGLGAHAYIARHIELSERLIG